MNDQQHMERNHILVSFRQSRRDVDCKIERGKIGTKNEGKPILLHRDVEEFPLYPTWCTWECVGDLIIVRPVEG